MFSARYYDSKGDREKAIDHFEVALGIASPFGWHDHLFGVHYSLARLFHDQGRFDDTNFHLERAKSHTVNSAYNLGLATQMQAGIWYKQHRLEEATSEVVRVIDVYASLGAAKKVEDCKRLLRYIEKEQDTPAASFNCELR